MFNGINSRLYVNSSLLLSRRIMLRPGKTQSHSKVAKPRYAASVQSVASVPLFGGFPCG